MGVFYDFCNYKNENEGQETNISLCGDNFNCLYPFSNSSSNSNEPNFNFKSKTLDEKNNNNYNKFNIQSNDLKQIILIKIKQ